MTKTQVARSPCQLLSLQKLNYLAVLREQLKRGDTIIELASVAMGDICAEIELIFLHHLDALSSPKALSAHHGT